MKGGLTFVGYVVAPVIATFRLEPWHQDEGDVEQITDSETLLKMGADFWTVYGRHDGGLMAIGDFDTREIALGVARAIAGELPVEDRTPKAVTP